MQANVTMYSIRNFFRACIPVDARKEKKRNSTIICNIVRKIAHPYLVGFKNCNDLLHTGEGPLKISSIRLENFKAFKDTGNIGLAKINLVVGKNSAGKSSLVKAILACSQTSSEKKVDNSDLRLVGNYTDLGTFSDVVYGKDDSKSFSIHFGVNNKKSNHKLELKYKFSSGPGLISAKISCVEAIFDGKFVCSARGAFAHQELFDVYSGGTVLTHSKCDDTVQGDRESEEGEVELPDFLRKLKQIVAEEREKAETANPEESVSHVVLNDFKIKILPFVEVKRDKKKIWSHDSLLISDYPLRDQVAQGSAYLDSILSSTVYIGPMRDEPTRSARLAVSSGNTTGKKGEHLTGLLHTKLRDEKFKEKLNRYLSKLGIADGITTGESYQSAGGRKRNTGYINILLEKNGQYNSLVDVGFGTSQVLPVVFELMAHENRLILIEHPEQHLHPYAQSEIGDLLVDSKNKKNQLIVETHSVTMIERIRRLIRNGNLDPIDVKILYIQSDEKMGSSICKQIGFLSDGTFDNPWPEKEFFGEREAESLSDWW